MEIGERIHYYRKLRGLTQEDVAIRLGTTPQNIYKYEKGIIKNIPLSSIVAMSELFGVSSAELAGMTEDSSPQLPPSSLSEKEAFGIRLRNLREAAGLSVRELGLKLHVIPHIIVELEDGTANEISESMILKLASFFGKSPEYFKESPLAEASSELKLNETERLVVVKYRSNPQYHNAIHQLLGISPEDVGDTNASLRYRKMTSSDFDNASSRSKIAQTQMGVYHTDKKQKDK